MSDLSVYRYDVAPIPPEEGGGYIVRFPDIQAASALATRRKKPWRTVNRRCLPV